jgi:hypothetical protein
MDIDVFRDFVEKSSHNTSFTVFSDFFKEKESLPILYYFFKNESTLEMKNTFLWHPNYDVPVFTTLREIVQINELEKLLKHVKKHALYLDHELLPDNTISFTFKIPEKWYSKLIKLINNETFYTAQEIRRYEKAKTPLFVCLNKELSGLHYFIDGINSKYRTKFSANHTPFDVEELDNYVLPFRYSDEIYSPQLEDIEITVEKFKNWYESNKLNK